jgi:hypothetical protein
LGCVLKAKEIYFKAKRKCATILIFDERYQFDATILFIIINISSCFGHLYADIQEYRCVYHCIWCSALGVVSEVLRSRYPTLHLQTYTQCTRLHTGSSGPQPEHLVLNTISSSIHTCTPEDGHVDARNVKRYLW